VADSSTDSWLVYTSDVCWRMASHRSAVPYMESSWNTQDQGKRRWVQAMKGAYWYLRPHIKACGFILMIGEQRLCFFGDGRTSVYRPLVSSLNEGNDVSQWHVKPDSGYYHNVSSIGHRLLLSKVLYGHDRLYCMFVFWFKWGLLYVFSGYTTSGLFYISFTWRMSIMSI